MKKLILISFIILGFCQIGFAQFNLKHGRVYSEKRSMIPNWITPRIVVEGNDSVVIRKIAIDSFIAVSSNSHISIAYGNPNPTISLKTDSVTGDIWFRQLDLQGNYLGMKLIYHYPQHNHWFKIWYPVGSFFYFARVLSRGTMLQNNKTYETQEVIIRLYPDTTIQGSPEVVSTWVKGIGPIGPGRDNFFHISYFGLVGGYDSIATYPLCVKNPLDPSDFQYVNPMFNTCFLRISGISKTHSQESMAYPNPTSGRFKLRGYKDEEGLTLRLFNNSGKEVWRGVPSPEGEVDISNLSPGLYHVEALTTSGKRWSTRVVRE